MFDKIVKRIRALYLVFNFHNQVKESTGKGLVRQIFEVALAGAKGFDVKEYYLLGMHRDFALVNKFMPRAEYDVIRRHWNPPVSGIFEFNKWIFSNYCRSLDIPTPDFYGIFNIDFGVTIDGEPLRNFRELQHVITSIDGPFVVKPVAGEHGIDVIVFDRFDARSSILTRANGERLKLDDLYSLLSDREETWLLQSRVRQHPELTALNQSSTNTVRIITLRDVDAEFKILGAILRIGIGKSEIDNTHAGGLVAPIDLETGTCAAGVLEHSIETYSHHPDSGCRIQGFVLPNWDRIKETAINAHRALPFARSLGWDLAVCEDGPTVLEVNGTWYHNGVQVSGLSLRDTPFASI